MGKIPVVYFILQLFKFDYSLALFSIHFVLNLLFYLFQPSFYDMTHVVNGLQFGDIIYVSIYLALLNSSACQHLILLLFDILIIFKMAAF